MNVVLIMYLLSVVLTISLCIFTNFGKKDSWAIKIICSLIPLFNTLFIVDVIIEWELEIDNVVTNKFKSELHNGLYYLPLLLMLGVFFI